MDRGIFEEEHEMFRDAARSFLQNEIGPHADRWAEQEIVDREAFLKAGEQGMLCMWADEKYGGAGVSDFRYEQILLEENAQSGLSLRCLLAFRQFLQMPTSVLRLVIAGGQGHLGSGNGQTAQASSVVYVQRDQ